MFVRKSKIILREVSDLKNMVNTELSNLEFKVGVLPTSPYLIPLISGSFSQKYPKSILRIEEMQSDDWPLYKKRCDIGILVTLPLLSLC
jgi:LysR family hydrogen peroxide-inducible transcriptional activator